MIRRTIILSIVISVIATDIFSQISLDKSLPEKYQLAFDRLPSQIKLIVSSLKKDSFGIKGYFAIIDNYKFDTLNIMQLKQKFEPVKYYSTDDEGNEYLDSTNEYNIARNYPFFICIPQLQGDILILDLGLFFSKTTIHHEIYNNLVISQIEEYDKYDSIFKSNLTDPLTNKLKVQAKTNKFALSDISFAPGKLVYGSAEITSDVYYKLENGEFLKLQKSYKYYLKFIIE
jgi:hypothetical protein